MGLWPKIFSTEPTVSRAVIGAFVLCWWKTLYSEGKKGEKKEGEFQKAKKKRKRKERS